MRTEFWSLRSAWTAILTGITLTVELNAAGGPGKEWIIPCDQEHPFLEAALEVHR